MRRYIVPVTVGLVAFFAIPWIAGAVAFALGVEAGQP